MDYALELLLNEWILVDVVSVWQVDVYRQTACPMLSKAERARLRQHTEFASDFEEGDPVGRVDDSQHSGETESSAELAEAKGAAVLYVYLASSK